MQSDATDDMGAASSSVPIEFAEKKAYKIVRHYLMGEVIGEGSQAKVREALDASTLRRVAVKIVNLRQLRKVRNAEAGFKRELSIQRRLKHRHVVEMIECFNVEHKEKQKVYVVLEHVPGGSLQDLLEGLPDGVLPMGMARRFARQLFDGLGYCHAQGVVHRDIKPSNLLIAADGVLRIADFGSADELSRFDATDACSKSRGSPAFQPPEVAKGDAAFAGFKVDVWACGVSLYRMTTGIVPFEGSSLMHLFENIAKGDFEIPAAILHDAPLVALLRGLLTVEQEQRLSVANALEHAWVRERDDSMRWGEHERLLVASISRGSLVDGKGWDAVVAAAAAAMDGGMLTVNGWPAGTSPFSTPASTPRGTPLATPIASRESSSSVVVS